jgi:hypothetical protein
MNSKPVIRMIAALLLLWPSGALRAQTTDEVKELKKQIEDLEKTLAALKLKVEVMEQRQAPSAVAAPPQPDLQGAALISSPVVSNPLSQRETSRRDAETVARVDNTPLDPRS